MTAPVAADVARLARVFAALRQQLLDTGVLDEASIDETLAALVRDEMRAQADAVVQAVLRGAGIVADTLH